MTTAITTSTFPNAVLASDKPVLVDFWAPWCGPCRMVGPVVEKIGRDLSATHVVVKVNVDEEPDLAAQFGVQSIPTLLLFKGGKVVAKTVGFQPEPQLKQFVLSHS
jgi:thioredoxin 1